MDRKKKKHMVTAAVSLSLTSVLVNRAFDPEDILTTAKRELSEDAENYSYDLAEKKKMVEKIPFPIRLFVLFPLWLLGFAVTQVLKPLQSLILTFLIVLLTVVIMLKLLFPDIPLKKLLNKKTLLYCLIASVILRLCDLILPHYFENYVLYRRIFQFTLGLILIGLILHSLYRTVNRIKVIFPSIEV